MLLKPTLTRQLSVVLRDPPTLQGMRLSVLRETRMPAVLCSLGPVRDVVDSTDAISAAIVDSMSGWTVAPLRVSPDG